MKQTKIERLKELIEQFAEVGGGPLADTLDETHFANDYTDEDIALLKWLFENGVWLLERTQFHAIDGCVEEQEILDSLEAVGKEKEPIPKPADDTRIEEIAERQWKTFLELHGIDKTLPIAQSIHLTIKSALRELRGE